MFIDIEIICTRRNELRLHWYHIYDPMLHTGQIIAGQSQYSLRLCVVYKKVNLYLWGTPNKR